MIEIKCSTQDSILLTEVVPFQGNLKKRTSDDIKELKDSITREGLLMPFAIWKHDGKNYLLDGHGRLEVLTQLAIEDPSILTTGFPCVFIESDTEDNARKALLQITSSYGKITKKGAEAFMLSIPNYVAPSVKKFVAPVTTDKKVKVTKEKPVVTQKVFRVRVPVEKADMLMKLLSTVPFIEVL